MCKNWCRNNIHCICEYSLGIQTEWIYVQTNQVAICLSPSAKSAI